MTEKEITKMDFTTQDTNEFKTESLSDMFSGDFEKKLGGLSFWSGTQAQYDAIVTKNPTTLYFIAG